MPTLSEFNQYGEELERLLMLRTSPVAVKMLEKEEDIPEGAIRPRKDRGYHLAQCQAFALSRRDKETVAMLIEDHWCPAALMAYGMAERPESAGTVTHPYDCFEYGKYVGIVTAPLKKAAFIPDVVIIYTNTAQLRGLLLSIKMEDALMVNGHFYPPSCGHAVVSVMLTGQYRVVLPDPGEFQRALTGEDEMMFSVPGDKLERFVSDLKQGEEKEWAYTRHNMLMRPDFPQPEIYKNLFRTWGLDVQK
ncbi:MAG: DUF169 domain-containing protein [Dehalococcoidales bacterium]|nr:DUF169 domain-containing protein [Dehalococcoidales bacterium]